MIGALTTRQEVEAFIATYKTVFETLDPSRIVKFYGAPLFGLSASVAAALRTPEEVMQNFVKVTDDFRSAGLSSADYEILPHRCVSESILEIPVNWVLKRADGSILNHLNVVYVLWRAAAGWLITAVYTV